MPTGTAASTACSSACGDQVLVVTGEDADGNALDQKMLENLAAEAVSAFTPVRTGD